MSMVKHFEANTKGRDFVVGDIHGCAQQFFAVLKAAGFNHKTDRCFSVGDLVDRGPDSIIALALLHQPWFHAVRGNHEEIFLMCVMGGGDWNWWDANGGAWARDMKLEDLKGYAELINALPYAITVGKGEERFNVIHAEFFGDDAAFDAGDYEPHIAERMVWGRALISGQVHPAQQTGLSRTYCGHTIRKQPHQLGAQHFIDTGAFLSHWSHGAQPGCLTLVEPKSGKTWSAS